MAWIESHQDIREHPKTYALMEKLHLDKRGAVGMVHLLWWWVLDNAMEGEIRQPNGAVARAVEWDGDARELVDALISSGWLDREEGYLRVHDWLERAGPIVEKRLHRKALKKKIGGSRTAAERRPNGSRTASKKLPTVSVSVSEPKDTTAPENGAVANGHPPNGENDLQRVVKGWKVLTGIPTEGPDSASWDKVHFARHAKSAKALIDLFGSRVDALRCMELVHGEMTKKKLTCTIETVVKHSDLYRERLEKREG
jgi:hypothetical protein